LIPRYSLPRMTAIWEPKSKFDRWLQIEILACEALAEMGEIPADALARIKDKAAYDLDRIEQIERETRHDVIAFLSAVAEKVGEDSRYIHLGMTSSDLLDTTLALQLSDAGQIILEDLDRLICVLGQKAREYRGIPMVGRTHGIHAEPITLGLKMASWYAETKRNRERMDRAREDVRYGKLSGAVGTFAHLSLRVEEYVCQRLGLKPDPVSTQVISRDRHAHYLSTLALIASSLERFATEIRHLQRTEVLEAEEPFAKGQKGSSAMPHKRNPISSEQICGLARVVRSYASASLENIALWHERDISHSSVERIIMPDATILIHYMLVKFTDLVGGLRVYPERMKKNLGLTHGLIFSERVLLKLARRCRSREEAYALVQQNAMRAWESGEDFLGLLLADARIREILSEQEIRDCFDLDSHLRNEDAIYQRVGL
jgi:adenylosuccinate lyase